MAVVGAGVDGFLYGHIVAVAVAGHHDVVAHKVRGDFGQLLLDEAAHDFSHLAGSGSDGVGVVGLAVGGAGVAAGGEVHKVRPRGFISQALYPVQGRGGHVQESHSFLLRHLLHSGGVVPVASAVELAFLEPAAGDRGEEHRGAAFLAYALDEDAQVVLICSPGSGVALGVGFLGVVVPEFDEYVVSGAYGLIDLGPEAFVDEALGAASVLGVVDDFHFRIQEVLEHHTPAPLGIAFGEVFLGHSAVSHQMDGEGAANQPEGGKSRRKQSFHHNFSPFTVTLSKLTSSAKCTSAPFLALKQQSVKSRPRTGCSGRPLM